MNEKVAYFVTVEPILWVVTALILALRKPGLLSNEPSGLEYLNLRVCDSGDVGYNYERAGPRPSVYIQLIRAWLWGYLESLPF